MDYYYLFEGSFVVWGGHRMAHARAQEDSWKRTINFLAKHINSHNRYVNSRL